MTEQTTPPTAKQDKTVVTHENTNFKLAYLAPKYWPLLCGVSLLWLVPR